LIDGSKHSFEDGEPVVIRNVEGMRHKDEGSKSINETIHQIKVINSKSFEIGDTTMYEPYIRNGTVKNIKTSIFVRYRSMSEVFQSVNEKLPID
jgi:baculoviral IAP repeat-containing protein 6